MSKLRHFLDGSNGLYNKPWWHNHGIKLDDGEDPERRPRFPIASFQALYTPPERKTQEVRGTWLESEWHRAEDIWRSEDRMQKLSTKQHSGEYVYTEMKEVQRTLNHLRHEQTENLLALKTTIKRARQEPTPETPIKDSTDLEKPTNGHSEYAQRLVAAEEDEQREAKRRKTHRAAHSKKITRAERLVLKNPNSINDRPSPMSDAIELVQDGLYKAQLPRNALTDLAYAGESPELYNGKDKITIQPHQREAIGRLMDSVQRRGCFLLGDDMGLGKTITIVAYIKISLDDAEKEGKKKKKFMVVTPKTLLVQWKKALAGAQGLRFAVYHSELGSTKCSSDYLWNEHDVVLTTYGTLQSSWKSLKDCQTIFAYAQKGIAHDKVRRSAACRRKQKRPIVHPQERPSQPLFAHDVDDVIMDEWHETRNRLNDKAIALLDLEAKNKIAITGTPFQNHPWDIFTLFRLFRLQPFADQKFFQLAIMHPGKTARKLLDKMNVSKRFVLLNCALQSISIRRERDDEFEGKTIMRIPEPIPCMLATSLDASRQQTQRATQSLWASEGVAPADKNAKTQKPSILDISGRDSLIRLLYQARRDSVHPDLLSNPYSADIETDYPEYDEEAEVRAIWDTEMETAFRTKSKKLRTNEDPSTQTETTKRLEKSDEKRSQFQRLIKASPGRWASPKLAAIVKYIRDAYTRIDAKALLYEDEKSRKAFIGRSKVLVFSDHLSTLDVLEIGLEANDIQCLRYDGTKSSKEREVIVKDYMESEKDFDKPEVQPSQARVLLATKKSCSQGLNLQNTAVVITVEPSWNPMVDEQAISRAVRIGNKSQVRVVRCVTLRSIEVYVSSKANMKRNMATNLLSLEVVLRNLKWLRNLGTDKVKYYQIVRPTAHYVPLTCC